jgi:hypothetical protein
MVVGRGDHCWIHDRDHVADSGGGNTLPFHQPASAERRMGQPAPEILKEIEEISAGVAILGSSERNCINTGNEQLILQTAMPLSLHIMAVIWYIKC